MDNRNDNKELEDITMLVVDGHIYSYERKPFEVINFLGFLRAVLTEYIITGADGEIYKLYKTSDKSWYDFATNPKINMQLLHLLKSQIDIKENDQDE